MDGFYVLILVVQMESLHLALPGGKRMYRHFRLHLIEVIDFALTLVFPKMYYPKLCQYLFRVFECTVVHIKV